MTQTAHDRTIAWLAEYIRTNPADLMIFRDIRKKMRTAGDYYVACHLLDNKFLYGRFLQEARELAQQN